MLSQAGVLYMNYVHGKWPFAKLTESDTTMILYGVGLCLIILVNWRIQDRVVRTMRHIHHIE